MRDSSALGYNSEDNSTSSWKKALIYGGIPSISLAILRGFFTYVGIRKNQYNGFNEGFSSKSPVSCTGAQVDPAILTTLLESGISMGTASMLMLMMYSALKTGQKACFFALGLFIAIFDFGFTTGVTPGVSIGAAEAAKFEGYLAANISQAKATNPYSFLGVKYPDSVIGQTAILDGMALLTCFVALSVGYMLGRMLLRNNNYELDQAHYTPIPQ